MNKFTRERERECGREGWTNKKKNKKFHIVCEQCETGKLRNYSQISHLAKLEVICVNGKHIPQIVFSHSRRFDALPKMQFQSLMVMM